MKNSNVSNSISRHNPNALHADFSLAAASSKPRNDMIDNDPSSLSVFEEYQMADALSEEELRQQCGAVMKLNRWL